MNQIAICEVVESTKEVKRGAPRIHRGAVATDLPLGMSALFLFIGAIAPHFIAFGEEMSVDFAGLASEAIPADAALLVGAVSVPFFQELTSFQAYSIQLLYGSLSITAGVLHMRHGWIG